MDKTKPYRAMVRYFLSNSAREKLPALAGVCENWMLLSEHTTHAEAQVASDRERVQSALRFACTSIETKVESDVG